MNRGGLGLSLVFSSHVGGTLKAVEVELDTPSSPCFWKLANPKYLINWSAFFGGRKDEKEPEVEGRERRCLQRTLVAESESSSP